MNENTNTPESKVSIPQTGLLPLNWKQKVANTAIQVLVTVAFGIAVELTAQATMSAVKTGWEKYQDSKSLEIEPVDESIEEL